MTLASGVTLGPYEILAPLGAGGMGVVYKARDTRLNRTVALKVLPAHVSADPEARQRFEREAQTIASLRHPNICVLHDVGREFPTPPAAADAAAGAPAPIDFLVMEYLEGVTLAARIAQRPLPAGEAIAIAGQVADALDAAHRSGVVHRDLKPGNILLVPGTTVTAKLLDFGLARSTPVQVTDGSQTRTLEPAAMLTVAAPLTAAGAILGTFQYMAPEQIEGQPADARADIFAFGCVLYEMLTGRSAFERGSPASMMAAVLTTTPPAPSTIVPLSPRLDHIIRRCLEKQPARRWQSIRDVALELQSAGDPQDPLSVALTGGAAAATPRQTRGVRAWLVPVIAIVALMGASTAAGVYLRTPAAEPTAVRFEVPAGGIAQSMSISPDGRTIAYAAPGPDGATALWVRELDSLEPRLLHGAAGNPDWSPDGRSIVFAAPDATLKRIDVAGGPPQTLTSLRPGGYQRATWNREGIIVFSNGGSLYRVHASGGEAVQISVPDTSLGETTHATPWFLPDGRRFLYTAWGPVAGNRAVYVGSLDDAEPDVDLARVLAARVRLMPAESKAIYVEPGYLLFLRDRTLMARPFDAGTLAFTGEARPLAEHVIYNPISAAAAFSASPTTIIYRRDPAETVSVLNREWRWLDPSGNASEPLGNPHGDAHVALSPDGARIAFTAVSGDNQDIWIHEVARGLRTRLTFDAAVETIPLWSPDSARVLFMSNRAMGNQPAAGPGARPGTQAWTLFQKPANGAVEERPLLTTEPGVEMIPAGWSPDGPTLVAVRAVLNPAGNDLPEVNIWTMRADGAEAAPYLTTPFLEVHPSLAPNGRWLAYVTTESETAQVVVQAFPDPSGGKWQISTDGGMAPRWRRDGRELYYLDRTGRLIAVPVVTEGRFEMGTPTPLFQTPFAVPAPRALNVRVPYDVSADGQRFLLSLPIEAPARDTPIVVFGSWRSAVGR